jgi:D-alanyl-D-alanine carboxypeptidase
MKYYSIFIALLVTVLFSACARHESSTATLACTEDFGFTDSSSTHKNATIYNALLDDLIKGGIPAASIMIEDEDGLWYGAKGLADIENNTKMQPCHGAKIASITKLFTAVMAYKLIDSGKIKLTDKISNYLSPDIISKLPNAEFCTIADLLQHSSGINDFVFNPNYVLYVFNNLDKDKSYEKLLSFSYNQDPAFPYGQQRKYNYTVNYILMALIINNVLGYDHAVAQRNQVFNAIPLKHTFFRPVENIPWNNIAKGYFDYRQAGALQELTSLFTGDGSGFTGIYSTSNDLRLYMNALFKDKKLISNSSLTSMISSPTPDDSESYGIGCRGYNIPVGSNLYHWYGHPGGEVNYASGAYYCPEKKATITYVLNYGDAFKGKYSDVYLNFRRKIFRVVSEN